MLRLLSATDRFEVSMARAEVLGSTALSAARFPAVPQQVASRARSAAGAALAGFAALATVADLRDRLSCEERREFDQFVEAIAGAAGPSLLTRLVRGQKYAGSWMSDRGTVCL